MAVIPPVNFNERIIDKLMAPTTRMKNWLDAVTLGAQTLEGTSSPEGLVNGKIGQRFLNTERLNYYWKALQGGNTGWQEQSRVATNVIEVFTLKDLPAAVNNVIRLADRTDYFFKVEEFDLEDNQVIQGTDTFMDGIHDELTKVFGTTDGPLFQTNGTSGFKAFNLALEQRGSGELANLDTTAQANTLKMESCTISGGDVRLVNGAVFIGNQLAVEEGCRIVQDGSPSGGGATSVLLFNVSAIFGLPFGSTNVDGVMNFEAGSFTTAFRFTGGGLINFNQSTLINVELDASIGEFLIEQTNARVFGTGGTIVKVANPNDISQGTISNTFTQLLGPDDRINVCDPISSSSVTTTDALTPVGICQDGAGNIIVSDPSTDTIIRYTQMTGSVTGSIGTPGSDVGALAWLGGKLYSVDTVTLLIYQHVDPFGTNTVTSILAPASNPSGIVFVGEDLLSSDSGTNLIYEHEGFTTTTTSFASPAVTTQGLAYDGVNALIGDFSDSSVYVQEGVSATSQYSFISAATAQEDIWITLDHVADEVGFVVIDSDTDEFHLYEHPVTFDHSSSTWEFTNVAGKINSSDRGGIQFADTDFPLINTLSADVWTDIEDDGDVINYDSFSETEKMVIKDETIGEILWLGTRVRGRTISSQVTLKRPTSSGTANYEISLVINGVVQKDSITFGAISSNLDSLTMSTLPISRDITFPDIIKQQIRVLTGGTIETPEVGFAKVAIT